MLWIFKGGRYLISKTNKSTRRGEAPDDDDSRLLLTHSKNSSNKKAGDHEISLQPWKMGIKKNSNYNCENWMNKGKKSEDAKWRRGGGVWLSRNCTTRRRVPAATTSATGDSEVFTLFDFYFFFFNVRSTFLVWKGFFFSRWPRFRIKNINKFFCQK